MGKKEGRSLKGFIIVGLVLVAALYGLQAYLQRSDTALDEKAAIEEGVRRAKQARPSLTAEEEEFLRLNLALLAFVAKNRVPPNNLADLVPTYFDTVPRNPSTRENFFYERNGPTYVLRPRASAQVQVAALASEESGTKEGGEGFVNPNTLEGDDFVYDPSGKRDPFRPFDLAPKRQVDESLSPLERYSLGQLRLAAVLNDADGAAIAIVEDESGKGFTVRQGMKMGNNGGIVVSIEPNKLKVLESTVDFTGQETQNVTEFVLAKDKGGKDQTKPVPRK